MHQTCPAKYDLRMNEGWTSRRRSGALGFGAALHEGIAAWYKTGSIEKAIVAIHTKWPDGMPVDDWRTKEKCLTTMVQYVKEYPPESFTVVGAPDEPVVEVAFTLDTGMFLPCERCGIPKGEITEFYIKQHICGVCGCPREPIEYGGIYDLLVEFSGHLYVVDHKSTSVLGPMYFNQFKPNNQMTGYVWAAQQMSSKKIDGAIINAIGVKKTGPTVFKREITSRSAEGIESWLKNLWHACCSIQHHKLTGYWPLNTSACTQYGQCEYHSVHVLESARDREKRLDMDYVREHWNHEDRDG